MYTQRKKKKNFSENIAAIGSNGLRKGPSGPKRNRAFRRKIDDDLGNDLGQDKGNATSQDTGDVTGDEWSEPKKVEVLNEFFENGPGREDFSRPKCSCLFFRHCERFFVLDVTLTRPEQGCQMVCFQTKNPNLGKLGGSCNGR
jgi:hypothetical protein